MSRPGMRSYCLLFRSDHLAKTVFSVFPVCNKLPAASALSGKKWLGRTRRKYLNWSKNNLPSKIVWSSLWDYHWIKEVYYFFIYLNANSVIQVYKFKLIFKKIKALYLSYVFPRILTLLLSYLKGESEKQTHLCRTIELSDYRAVRLSDCRTSGLSDYSYAPTCDRSVVFPGYSGFLHQYNWPPRYNWNIV